ncbi:MAG: hypothetical protein RLY57_287 [Candidatus Parcubacteria bacterium]|jgi:small-conductance mechanosensitive channel
MALQKTISWQAHEYFHQEKSNDWYWGLGIVATTAAILAIILGNTLFALVIILFAFASGMQAHREPRLLNFELTNRGIVINHVLYPYSTLESFSIGEQHLNKPDPKVLIKSKKVMMSYIHLPVEEIDIEDVRDYLLMYLREEELEESFLEKLLEYFGF